MTADHSNLIAPLGPRAAGWPSPWQGQPAERRPQEYPVLVLIPHLDPDTTEPVETVIELLRLQTVRPMIAIIDTGSPPEVCDRLERLRAADCEIHRIHAHGWTDSSEPVCAALDLGFALSRGIEHVFLTHTDVFLTARTVLQELRIRCGPDKPFVGYQMSNRTWATDDWKMCFGHACLMVHAPTYHEHGLSWSQWRLKYSGRYGRRQRGWPDTETPIGYLIRDAGLEIDFLGRELNFERQVTRHFDHARSYAGTKIYASEPHPCGPKAPGEMVPAPHDYARQWMEDALRQARGRIEEWRNQGELRHAA